MPDAKSLPNSLLANLSDTAWESMRSVFREVPLRHGDSLMRANETFKVIYFPVAGVVSTVALFEDGRTAEMATVGREGFVGIGAVIGSETAIGNQVVQVAGGALAVDYDNFRLFQRTVPAFQRVLLDYAQSFTMQVLQSVACNALHSLEERAARWLLMCDDRAGDGGFVLTQQFLAEMLGASRPRVSTLARTFQSAGLIRYQRGTITIIDRAGLEKTSCDCYAAIRAAYESRNIRLQ